jgi:hypothetical protein
MRVVTRVETKKAIAEAIYPNIGIKRILMSNVIIPPITEKIAP